MKFIKKLSNFWKITPIFEWWILSVAIAKQLYEYKHPFQINDYFLTWKTSYQFQVIKEIKNRHVIPVTLN